MTDWNLNGIRIFVTGISDETGQIVARLQPLSGGTINQRFGYESPIYTLNCYIVGDATKESLENLVTGGDVVLVSPEGTIGNFLVQKVVVKREPSISQTIRTDLSCDSPVYTVEIVMLKD